jgi:hypothetical protein
LIIYSLLKNNPKVINIIIKGKEIVSLFIVLEIKKDNLKEKDFDNSLINNFFRFFLIFILLIFIFYSFHSLFLLINFYNRIIVKSLLLIYY